MQHLAQDCGRLSLHASRGALFENFVISELLKQRMNQGLPSNLTFWSNNTGEEVDVLVEQGEQLMPIEIKSGQTFHPEHLASLTKWLRYADTAARPPRLVYGGDEVMTRGGVSVLSWRQMGSLLQEI